MKARLVKKEDIKPAPRWRKRVARAARRGGPCVDPRAAFEALFASAVEVKK